MRGCRGAAREMPCEACGVQFSVFRRKRACGECARLYCAACLRRGGGICAPCRALSTRPLQRAAIAHLKPRDLQCFLHRQNVSTRGCVEKEDLISLCACHVNSAAYRRRGASSPNGAGTPFTLKGLTNNINDFINTTFSTQPAPPAAGPVPPRAPPAASPPAPPAAPPRERFTTNPGGERDFRVPPPPVPRSESRDSEGAPLDTTDCFEVEDLDDQGWEFVTRPADPLPNDSSVLMASPEAVEPPPLPPSTPRRASSLLDLRPPPPAPEPRSPQEDRVSLSDEPLLTDDQKHDNNTLDDAERSITLDQLSAVQLEMLSVRALKGLLARNRVEFQSCVERAELLERAQALLADHVSRRAHLDSLPLEECCKICMAAPLECVLLECGHIAACTACAKQLSECPICRRYVVRAVRCFRA